MRPKSAPGPTPKQVSNKGWKMELPAHRIGAIFRPKSWKNGFRKSFKNLRRKNEILEAKWARKIEPKRSPKAWTNSDENNDKKSVRKS